MCVCELSPLSIHRAHSHAPQVRAELGQLRNVVSHLRQKHSMRFITPQVKQRKREKEREIPGLVSYLTSRQASASLIKLVYVGGKGHEIRDDKLLAESLGQEHDITLDTSDQGRRNTAGGGGGR